VIATEMLNAFAESWTDFMLGGLIDGSILLVLLCLLWLLLRRRVSAQFRYCLFLLVLLRVVLPLQVTLPRWCEFLSPSHVVAHLFGAARADRPATHLPTITDDFELAFEEDLSDVQQSQSPVLSPTGASLPPPRLSLASQIMLGWAAVVVGLLAWTLVMQRRLRRVLLRATQIESEEFEIDLDELRTRVGVRQHVPILASSELVSPAVAGLWNPRILLPADFADSLGPQQLRWIISHELAHIRRRDLWLAGFQKAVQIVHFFNPAIWLTNWIINRQREYACDDAALASGDVPRRECAAAFLSIVERVNRRPDTAPLPLSFLRSPNPLRRRLMRILDTDRPLRPRLTLGSILVLTVIASFVVPQVRPEVWAQNEGISSAKDPQSESPSAAVPAEAGSKPHSVEDRLESLEDEVRQLRKALRDLAAAHRNAGTSVPQRTAELFAPVKRMDLAIVNRQGEIVVVSPIKNLSGSRPAAIIAHLAPNGSQVKKGDLVTELDSENLRDELDVATINREAAKARMLQASARHDNQLAQNETTRAEDQLKVDLAEVELKTYKEATFPLELKKLQAKVEEAQEALEFAQKLAAKGYQSKGDVRKAENALSIAKSDLERLQKFDRTMQITKLEGALAQAMAALEATKHENAAKIAEAKAVKAAAAQVLALADEKIKSLESQIGKCKLLAPVDGIVRYSSNLIKQGTVVRERQPLLSIVPLSDEQEQVLKDVLVIPIAAVHKRGDRTACFVETPNGLEQRTIELGQSNSSFVQVIGGLKEGEKVLLGRVSLTEQPGRRSAGTPTPPRER